MFILLFSIFILGADGTDIGSIAGVGSSTTMVLVSSVESIAKAKEKFTQDCNGTYENGCIVCKGKPLIGAKCEYQPSCPECITKKDLEKIKCIKEKKKQARKRMLNCAAFVKILTSTAAITGTVAPTVMSLTQKLDEDTTAGTGEDAGADTDSSNTEDIKEEKEETQTNIMNVENEDALDCSDKKNKKACDCIDAGFIYDFENKECHSESTQEITNKKNRNKGLMMASSNRTQSAQRGEGREQNNKVLGNTKSNTKSTDTNSNASIDGKKHSLIDIASRTYNKLHPKTQHRRNKKIKTNPIRKKNANIFNLISEQYQTWYRDGKGK